MCGPPSHTPPCCLLSVRGHMSECKAAAPLLSFREVALVCQLGPVLSLLGLRETLMVGVNLVKKVEDFGLLTYALGSGCLCIKVSLYQRFPWEETAEVNKGLGVEGTRGRGFAVKLARVWKPAGALSRDTR